MESPSNRPSRRLISFGAWRKWEDLDCPFLLADVVDSLLALSPELRKEEEVLRPPGVLSLLTGTVHGRRFILTGVKDSEGRWIEILHVKEEV